MSEERDLREYLGDSVYADVDDEGRLKLYLDNGLGAHTVIIVEPEVWHAMKLYVTEKLGWK